MKNYSWSTGAGRKGYYTNGARSKCNNGVGSIYPSDWKNKVNLTGY